MFSAHLVFGDIDHHAGYLFSERVRLIEAFRSTCLSNKPELNAHSFFDVDNDSVMIGFSSLEGFLSGNDVLRYVLLLYRELMKVGVSISFGVNLIACVPEIDWSTHPGILNDIRMIYMPDEDYERQGRVLRNRLIGDPLIIVARILEIAKRTRNPICYALTIGGHFNDSFNHGRPLEPKIVTGWQGVIPSEHASFLIQRGIQDVYCLDANG